MDRRAAGERDWTPLSALRLGSLLLPVIGGLLWGIWSYHQEGARAAQQASDYVELVREYTERVVETQSIIKAVAEARLRQEGVAFLESEAFHGFLAAIEGSQEYTRGVAVIDLDGQVAASSRVFPVNLQVGPREYLEAMRAGAPLYIDRLVIAPQNEDSLVVVRPFDVEDFEGVIVSTIDVEAFRSFLRGIALNPRQAASLLREDGKLLLRNDDTEAMMLPAESPARNAIAEAPSGIYDAVATTDGVRRIYAYSKLGTLPLYANFGIPRSEVIQLWLWRNGPVWALLGLIGLFTFALTEFAQRGLKARIAAEENRKRLNDAERVAEERSRLMQELNHRVKNNLALVEALIAIQMRRKEGVNGAELRARIHAISEVHDLLYHSAEVARVDFGQLLSHICNSPAIVPEERHVTVHCKAEQGVLLDSGQATPLALIAVELLTNAVKHAFPGRSSGTIEVTLSRSSSRSVLEVRDDGIGMPPDVRRNSGLQIVRGFLEQINGEMEHRTENGSVFLVRFPLHCDEGKTS